jgi:hypothetical protein
MLGWEYFTIYNPTLALVDRQIPWWLHQISNGDRAILVEAVDCDGPIWGVMHTYN